VKHKTAKNRVVNFYVELLLVTYCDQYGNPFLWPNRPTVYVTPLQITVIQLT